MHVWHVAQGIEICAAGWEAKSAGVDAGVLSMVRYMQEALCARGCESGSKLKHQLSVALLFLPLTLNGPLCESLVYKSKNTKYCLASIYAE